LPTMSAPLHGSRCSLSTALGQRGDRGEIRRRSVAPTDGEAVRVTKIHVLDARQVARQGGRHDVEKSVEARVDVASAEPDLLSAAEHEPPRAALVHAETRE